MASSLNIVQGLSGITIGSDVGYLEDGARITPSVSLHLVGENVEQLTLPVKAYRVSESIEISFTMIEATIGAAASTGNIHIAEDIDNVTGGTNPLTVAWGDNQFTPVSRVIVIGTYVPGGNNYARSITAGKAVLSSPAEMNIGKQSHTQLPVTFTCLYDDQTNNRALLISDAQS